jgi:hypothetical protein
MSLPKGLVQKVVRLGPMRVHNTRKGQRIDVYDPVLGEEYPQSVYIDQDPLPVIKLAIPRPLSEIPCFVLGTTIIGNYRRHVNLVQRPNVYDITMQVLP